MANIVTAPLAQRRKFLKEQYSISCQCARCKAEEQLVRTDACMVCACVCVWVRVLLSGLRPCRRLAS